MPKGNASKSSAGLMHLKTKYLADRGLDDRKSLGAYITEKLVRLLDKLEEDEANEAYHTIVCRKLELDALTVLARRFDHPADDPARGVGSVRFSRRRAQKISDLGGRVIELNPDEDAEASPTE